MEVFKIGLIRSVKLNNGLEVYNAYYRLNSLSGDKDNIEFVMHGYASKSLRNEGAGRIDEEYYSFTPDTSEDATNFIKQAYEYLKTLPEYADAIDVIESD